MGSDLPIAAADRSRSGPGGALDRLLAEPDRRIAEVVQPLVDLRTGFVAGYEALSRFPGSERRPAAWFALAHAGGLGIELELLAAGRQLRLAGRPPGTWLSINLSASALVSGRAGELLQGDLTGLIIEITEAELVAEGQSLEHRLADLRDRGARLAVDDLGAGYAGISQVMRVRPDLLKIDRSLVDGVASDPAKEAMVDALVRFSRRIGAEVCAEGIESLADLRALADLDVAYGQGFVLARPAVPWPAVTAEASAVCASALRAVIRQDPEAPASGSSERGLERVCRRIGAVRSRDDLQALLEPMRDLLGVDGVAVSTLDASGGWLDVVVDGTTGDDRSHYRLADYPATVGLLATGTALQVLASDPGADPDEVRTLVDLGFRSLLILPLMTADRPIGVLEAYACKERPWSRSDIHRARILSYLLGLVLARPLDAPAPAPGRARAGLAAR